jgi:hypothetical protein
MICYSRPAGNPHFGHLDCENVIAGQMRKNPKCIEDEDVVLEITFFYLAVVLLSALFSCVLLQNPSTLLEI